MLSHRDVCIDACRKTAAALNKPITVISGLEDLLKEQKAIDRNLKTPRLLTDKVGSPCCYFNANRLNKSKIRTYHH